MTQNWHQCILIIWTPIYLCICSRRSFKNSYFMLKFICYKPVKIHDTLKPKFAFLNLPWGHFVNRKAKHALWSCLIQVLIALTTLFAAVCKASCDPFKFKFAVQIWSSTGTKTAGIPSNGNDYPFLSFAFWNASFHLVPTNFCRSDALQRTAQVIYRFFNSKYKKLLVKN